MAEITPNTFIYLLCFPSIHKQNHRKGEDHRDKQSTRGPPDVHLSYESLESKGGKKVFTNLKDGKKLRAQSDTSRPVSGIVAPDDMESAQMQIQNRIQRSKLNGPQADFKFHELKRGEPMKLAA